MKDENYIKDKYKSWRKSANKVQKLVEDSEEAKKWWATNKHRVYQQNIEYPISDPLPLLENTNSKKEVISVEPNVQSMKNFDSLNITLIKDLFWWNVQGSPSVVQVKLPSVLLRLIYIRYIENGIRKCSEVARLSGYQVSTVYRFFSELRKIIKEETLKNKS